ncbi:hypothetical protein Rwratislav_09668 [Rhodococcus wratislaviensis IFP 2016]|nr:hypothetical protein Rwratislav_09668 [Rhodococcus wratislaviensis IFP 2016]
MIGCGRFQRLRQRVFENPIWHACASENRLLIGSVITRSPTQREPNVIIVDFVVPGDMVARCTRRRSPTQSGPLDSRFLHQWRGRSREVTREVLLPLIVDGIQYIMRGGAAWWRLPVEFWSTGTVSAVFARKRPCTKLAQKLIARVCGSGFRRTRLHSTGHRNPHDQVQPAVPVRRCRRYVKRMPPCFLASPKRPTVRIRPGPGRRGCHPAVGATPRRPTGVRTVQRTGECGPAYSRAAP